MSKLKGLYGYSPDVALTVTALVVKITFAISGG
jgi:hypothetical protein